MSSIQANPAPMIQSQTAQPISTERTVTPSESTPVKESTQAKTETTGDTLSLATRKPAKSISPTPFVLGAASLLMIKPTIEFFGNHSKVATGLLTTGMAIGGGLAAEKAFKDGKIGQGIAFSAVSAIGTMGAFDMATNHKFGVTQKVLIKPLVHTAIGFGKGVNYLSKLAVSHPTATALTIVGVGATLGAAAIARSMQN